MLRLIRFAIIFGSCSTVFLKESDADVMSCQLGCHCGIEKSKNGFLPVAHCVGSNISGTPLTLPQDTEVLNLQENQLEYIDETSFSNLTHLRQLNLTGNQIAAIEDAFHNLSLLSRLSLGRNFLDALDNSTFFGLSALETLVLSDNRIVHLELGCFSPTNSLLQLFLSGNRLRQLPVGLFSTLAALKVLILDKNYLELIDEGTFSGLVKLENLSIASNMIRNIHRKAFSALGLLQYLNLAGNLLETIPSAAFRGIRDTLVWLSVEDNPTRRIRSEDFQLLSSLVELVVSRMSQLEIVDAQAFIGLESLNILRLHNNPHLCYLHPSAIVSCRRLRAVYLQDNNLTAISLDFLDQANALQVLRISGNSIRCDCNVRRIKNSLKLMEKSTRCNAFNVTNCFANETHRLPVCSSPDKLKGLAIKDVRVPAVCPPTVVVLFPGTIHRKLGDTLTLDCRGTGDPNPGVFWIVPINRILNHTAHNNRTRLDAFGSLTVTSLRPSDAGVYSCVTYSATGNDTVRTTLRIFNPNAHVLPLATDYDSITVTWSGTNSTMRSTDYAIAFRVSDTDTAFGTVQLSPYMRKYTVNGLQPGTTYEFCMTYIASTWRGRGDDNPLLGCTRLSTRSDKLVDGIRRLPIKAALIVVAATVVVVVLCIGVRTVCRQRQRKAYQTPVGVDQYRKVGAVSQIPLDNILHPPSTPIATSRTSLVGIH